MYFLIAIEEVTMHPLELNSNIQLVLELIHLVKFLLIFIQFDIEDNLIANQELYMLMYVLSNSYLLEVNIIFVIIF